MLTHLQGWFYSGVTGATGAISAIAPSPTLRDSKKQANILS